MDFPTFCSNNRLLLRRTSAASVAKERHSEGMRLVHSKLIDFYQYFFFQELQQNFFLKTGLHPSTLQLCFLAQHLELGEVKTSLSTSTYMHHPIMMVVLELLILQRVNLKMSNLLLKINKGSINLC